METLRILDFKKYTNKKYIKPGAQLQSGGHQTAVTCLEVSLASSPPPPSVGVSHGLWLVPEEPSWKVPAVVLLHAPGLRAEEATTVQAGTRWADPGSVSFLKTSTSLQRCLRKHLWLVRRRLLLNLILLPLLSLT